MSNRTEVVGGIWAYGAPDPPSELPSAGTTYANSALTESTINAAWPHANIVDSADFNEIMRRITSLVQQLEQYGTLPWCATTTYPLGAEAMGSDGNIYMSLQASNLNQDPTTATTYWMPSRMAVYSGSAFALNSYLAGKHSISGSAGSTAGYYVLPNGLIFQWGYLAFSSDYTVVSFPMTFPNDVLAIMATDWGVPNDARVLGREYVSPSQFKASSRYWNGSSWAFTAASFSWLAIGH